MKKAAVFMAVAFLLALGAAPVYADDIPPLPHAFYGELLINGNPAPAGTTVEARGGEVRTGIEGNPITTTEPGKYGSSNPLEQRLIVQGDILEGTIITFFVNDVSTEQTAEWHSGETSSKDLSVTITAPPGRGPGPAPRYYVDTNLFGIEASFRISDEGEILETIEATSADGMLTLTIPEGTIALDEDGNPLEGLEAAVDESPPDPPEGSYIIELAYDFGPDGATFDPAITLEYTYDPAEIPEDVAEEDLVLAYYDEETGEWVELDCVVDTENNTITADVEHFTTFAIIGAVTPPPAVFTVSSLSISPATVNIGETVTISLVVTNTGGKSGSYIVTLDINGVKEADETVTVAAGDSQEVSFSVTKEDAGIYSVAVAELTGSFTVVAPAAFSVSDLSLQPAQVKPGEAVTISASVANTGGESGSYTVVLKIDGVKEAEKTVTIAAGESLDVSFSVTKEEADTYTVTVDGLSGSFTVAPAEPPINWPVIGGIIGGVIVVGLLIFFLLRRRRAAY